MTNSKPSGLIKRAARSLSGRMDRLIRHLETPPPGLPPTIEHPRDPAALHERKAAMATLMAIDGLTIEANVAALEALARMDAKAPSMEIIGTLAHQVADMTADYHVLAADALRLPVTGRREPVWVAGFRARLLRLLNRCRPNGGTVRRAHN